ncbi:MAG: hypothetical protein HZB46_18150 [Solirubrobacterales bacterium]|nr:hypothetical protein [Solirubrobacterales bacterium]
MRTAHAAAAAAVVASLVAASRAIAAWSPPRTVRIPPSALVALAVDGRGDVAIAWSERGLPPAQGATVRVALRRAGGAFRTRTLWTSRRTTASEPAVAVDARGQVTVAWPSAVPGRNGGTIRAAYGPLSGRWHAARVVSAGLAPVRLAVAPDRDVLLTFAAIPPARGDQAFTTPGVAWRTAGHRFGRAARLSAPRLVIPVQATPAVPAFDAAGTAYVSSPCDSVVLRTRPGGRRFTTRTTLGPRQVLGFSLSVSRAGRGLASWVAGRCTADVMAGDTPGPVVARALAGGRFGAPQQLSTSATAYATAAVALPDGSGSVSWAERNDDRGDVLRSAVGADGVASAPQPVADALVPVTATRAGDQVLALAFANPPVVPGPTLLVRPAGGGPDQPAPHAPSLLVASSDGRAVAATWSTGVPVGSRMAVSVWRP